MNCFNVITACIRPSNLLLLYDSIVKSLNCINRNDIKEDAVINWYITMEARNYREPQLPTIDWITDERIKAYLSIGEPDDSPINVVLPFIETGWVCFLDDDNIMHPDFLNSIIREKYPAICIYHQQLTPIRAQTNPLTRYGAKCEVGAIDTAQFTLAAELIDYEWDAEHEQPDGKFINDIYSKYPALLRRVDHILCYYNYLTQIQNAGKPRLSY